MFRWNRRQRSAALLFTAVGGLLSAGARAATITAVGIDVNDPSWRTASVAKPYDGDGNNVYGSAGYLMFRTASTGGTTFTTTNGTSGTLNTLPGYLTVGSVATTGPDSLYGGKATIDNPAGGTFASGIAYRNTGFADTNNEPYLSLTIGSGLPTSGIRVGILDDNSGGNDTPTTVVLTQTTGSGSGSANFTDVITNNTSSGQPDWYFFDLKGAQSGDVFTLALGNRTSGAKPTVGGITVDVLPTPEPSSIALFAVAGLLALRRRRGAAKAI